MCEFCNIEKGKKELLMESDLKTELSENGEECGVMATGVYIDSDGYHSLYTEHISNDGKCGAEHIVRIDFCPWCGRELKHHTKYEFR